MADGGGRVPRDPWRAAVVGVAFSAIGRPAQARRPFVL